MKLTIDFQNKLVEVPEDTNFGELINKVKQMIPNWKEFTLRTTVVKFETTPYIPYVPYTPVYPLDPWPVTYTIPQIECTPDSGTPMPQLPYNTCTVSYCGN